MLFVAFEKSTDSFLKQVIKLLAGPYVHVELIVSPPDDTAHAYSAYMNETFAHTPQSAFSYSDDRYDFLKVPANEEELHRIHTACQTGVRTRIPYNLSDMVLSQLPFRSPDEEDFYHTKALFCSQALVLLLRASLDPDNPVQERLATLNSRTVSPSGLYRALQPHCPPKTLRQVVF